MDGDVTVYVNTAYTITVYTNMAHATNNRLQSATFVFKQQLQAYCIFCLYRVSSIVNLKKVPQDLKVASIELWWGYVHSWTNQKSGFEAREVIALDSRKKDTAQAQFVHSKIALTMHKYPL